MAVATFSGVAFMYAFLPGHRFPFEALVGLALPVVTIGLGIWGLRGRRIGALPSVIAIVVGICALVIIAVFVLVGLISQLH